MTGWYLALAGLLLLANGFFVAVEFALMTSRPERLEGLSAGGSRSAGIARDSQRELSLQLAGAQLGITMASLGLGYVGEPGVAHLLEEVLGAGDLSEGAVRGISVGIALTLVTFLHLVVGEMVPKNLAIAAPERTVVALAIPNRLYVAAFRPVIRALNAVANAGVRLFGVTPSEGLVSAHTTDELRRILAESHDEGVLPAFGRDLLSGALGFGERPVSSVMVPRDQVVAVAMRSSMEQVEQAVVRHGHSRVPVYGRDLDDVQGFVHAKDLIARPADSTDLLRLRRMLAVPDTASLADVLLRMQSARLHVALVVDGDRRTMGLVTLEDVLESLVGDIRDESDRT